MDVESFLSRWTSAPASERANSQPFLLELCALLGVPKPLPGNTAGYCFERVVKRHNADGTPRSDGRIDLYKEGCFVLESKQKTEKERQNTKAFDTGMIAAKQQAEEYAKFLPEWPPFLVVVDVGHAIELYADFSGTGKRYLPFTNHKFFTGHRLQLQQLREPRVRDLLAKIWTDPRSLDPSLVSQRVTKLVAEKLASISKSLEAEGHDAEAVASFLMRCIFTMFAEDVRLLPARSFTKKLEHWRAQPSKFAPQIQMLWAEMNVGGQSLAFDDRILRFNGGLFANTHAFALNPTQIGWLHEAATQDWTEVEPAIFGTLLERALNPKERHALGAHFTPRTYVERLVFPTVIEPLREDWDRVKVAVMARLGRLDTLKTDDARKKAKEAARKELLAFHHTLCATRVLDPACGTGNFLYVAMEHMKRLEGEVLDLLAQIEGTQRLALLSSSSADGTGSRETVDPHQFLGIEVNGRAAVIAELVLWIGYLQWHYRTFLAASGGGAHWHEPVLRQFGNIEHRDAILEWDGAPELVCDDNGTAVTRWDGVSTKKHPVTGEDVPDESKTLLRYRYVHPRKATWPKADFIVGNPPFIASRNMRTDLGDGYVEALSSACGLPMNADFAMYFWSVAATLVAVGDVRRSGLITTNSIRQKQNNKIVRSAIADGARLIFAIPDHPWSDGDAQVRISMTVVCSNMDHGKSKMLISSATDKVSGREDGSDLFLVEREIPPDLGLMTDVSSAVKLQANEFISGAGMKPYGAGFIVTRSQAEAMVSNPEQWKFLPAYANGRDVAAKPRGVHAVDLTGLTKEQVRDELPEIFNHLLLNVYPQRKEEGNIRLREEWWLFESSRPQLRAAMVGLDRYIVTVENSPERYFVFMPKNTLPDQKLRVICLSDAAHLAVLSSRIHAVYSERRGARHGKGNTPVYNSVCFDSFPFPSMDDDQSQRLRRLGERLDLHRKKQQEKHSGLTLTGVYNVLATLRSGGRLSDKEKTIYEQGLVGVLQELHDEIDDAVFQAYGWPRGLDDERILERLVALNHDRAVEESRGLIRWLRPEYQESLLDAPPLGSEHEADGAPDDHDDDVVRPAAQTQTKKLPWPDEWPERVAAVARALRASGGATVDGLTGAFRRAKPDDVEDILEALRDYGQVEQVDHEVFVAL